MRRLLLLLLFLFNGFSLGAIHAQTSTCNSDGTVTRESYYNNVSFRERYYSIYLPPCYDNETATYPVLMLLHGSNSDDSQWPRLGFTDSLDAAIQSGDSPSFIVVMPFGENIANENSFDGVTYDNILLDFFESIRATYRTNGVQAIGGISRGGFWAYQLGLRFPDQFVAIGGHSPFFDVYHAPPAYNPLDLALTITPDTHLKLWLDRGTEDYAADGVDRMHVNLEANDIPHEYILYPGGIHAEVSWEMFVDDYVDFYASAFEQEEIITPSAESVRGLELWIPAGGFPTVQTSIDSTMLSTLTIGEYNENLVLTDTALQYLTDLGFRFHADTTIVAEDNLNHQLWQNKSWFTFLPFDTLTMRYRPLWVDNIPVVDRLDSYPFVWESDTPNYDPDKLTRITLSGTTAVARQSRVAFDEMGVETAVSGIQDYVTRSDYFQLTHEASIVENCPQFTTTMLGGGNSMCMKPDHADLFSLLGVDVIDLTGNHINDYGYDPLDNTLRYFHDTDIRTVGGGPTLATAQSPLILKRGDSTIGWIACNHVGPYYAIVNEDANALGGVRSGAAKCDHNWLREALPILSSQVDVVLVTVQYLEYENYVPSAQQRIDYKNIADWGADIVVGTAEHKPMTFEFYSTQRGETAFIHYGLGNLFFDQPWWGHMRFFMDTLYIYDGQLHTVELFPGIIDDLARPRLLTGDDQFNFLYFMFVQQNGY